MKKVLYCIVSLMMIMSLNISTAFADIDTSDRKPVLNIVNGDMPVGKAGQKLTLDLNFESMNKYTAKNIDVTIKNEDPFEVENMTNTKRIDRIRTYTTKKLQFQLDIKGDAEGKTYPIVVTYKYQNEYGDQYNDEKTIYVKVLSGLTPSVLKVRNIKTDVEEINAGDKVTVSFDVKNEGTLLAKNINVSLEGLAKEAFTVTDGINNREITYLMPSSGKETVSFNLYTDGEMKTGNYLLKVKLDYMNSENSKVTDEQEFYLMVQGDDSSQKPHININNIIVPEQEVIPGNKFEVSFDISNTGKKKGENLVVSVDGGENILPSSQNIIVVDSLKVGESKKMVFELKPIDDAPAKSYLLNINVKGDDDKVDAVNQYASVKVGKLSDIIISDVVTSESTVSDNKSFNVQFDVENKGLGTAENLTLIVDGKEKVISKTSNIITISELKSNEKKHFSFDLQAIDIEESQNYPILIEVKNSSKDKSYAKQYFNVYLQKGAKGKTVPKVIISKFECTPKIVKAGDNFDLFLSFLNTNKIKAVSNVKIFLTVDTESSKTETTVGTGSVFTPVDGSNTFYIDDIKPKKEQSVALKMYTIPDAQPKNYTITANIEYEDEDGNPYTSKELIGIPVTQPSQLKVGDISVESNGTVGEALPLDIQLYNIGKVTMSNFMIEIEGDFEVETQDSFAGNVQPGTVAYYYGDLKPMKAGECKGQIVFSYDEPSGEHKEVRKDISVTAEEFIMPENPMGDMDNMQMEEEAASKGGKAKIVIIFGAVLAGVIVLVVVLKKRKKKKGMTLDE
jgi:hypothetical protein